MKKSESVNARTEPKASRDFTYLLNTLTTPKSSHELMDAVTRDIDRILKRETAVRHKELAEIYLERKKNYPLAFHCDLENFFKKGIKRLYPSGKAIPQALKTCINDWEEYWENTFREIKGRISTPTMNILEKNYDKQTIDKILKALVDFEQYLTRTATLDFKKIKKSQEAFKKQYQHIIEVTDFLLEKSTLSDLERKTVQGIKANHEGVLLMRSKIKKVNLDPIKETLLNLSACNALSGHEGWHEEYIKQCFAMNYTRSPGRPRSLFDKALMVVIYRLLKSGNNQFNRKYEFAAKIVKCCKGIDKKVTRKDIENAFHT